MPIDVAPAGHAMTAVNLLVVRGIGPVVSSWSAPLARADGAAGVMAPDSAPGVERTEASSPPIYMTELLIAMAVQQ
jgi:hypothetical protein